MKKKAPKPKLTMEMKKQIEEIFEPLISTTFGSDRYKRYSLDQAKTLVQAHTAAAIQAQTYSPPVLMYLHHALMEMMKTKSIPTLLMQLSELCLLEEELSDAP